MILWRISNHADLSGRGGVLFPGRWHHAGAPVVYLAESPAGALVEACVHTSANDIPPSFTLVKVVGPDVRLDELRLEDLPDGWTANLGVTRDLGSEWLERASAALLRAPCALIPATRNFLLNPLHADAALLRVEEAFRYPFAARLKT